MSDAAANKETVAQMWQRLYEKDWAGLEAMLAPDCHYEDVPAPDSGATGPANIVKRLRIGLDPVRHFEHDIHRVIAEGSSVVIEHTETWHFGTKSASGADEKIVNHFVTVHDVVDGKVALWRDYWDINTLMGQAPPWWLERIAKYSAEDFGGSD